MQHTNERSALERPTVVLLHSSASSSRQWSALAQMLRPRFEVQALDLYGHGERPAWPGPGALTLADEAALAARVVAAAPGGAHVVGHSYGAAVALKLAMLNPAAVRSLVVYEPVLFRWLADDPSSGALVRHVMVIADSIRASVARGDTHTAALRFVDFWAGPGAWATTPEAKKPVVAARMDAVRRHFDALFDEAPQRAQLVRYGGPMLFLTGGETVSAAWRLSQQYRKVLRHADHEVMSGMGHMGPITHAQQVNRRIEIFLMAQALPEDQTEAMTEPG